MGALRITAPKRFEVPLKQVPQRLPKALEPHQPAAEYLSRQQCTFGGFSRAEVAIRAAGRRVIVAGYLPAIRSGGPGPARPGAACDLASLARLSARKCLPPTCHSA